MNPVRNAISAIKVAVNEVLKINARVAELCVEARDVCLGEMDKFKQSRRAVKEYSENSG